MLSRVAAAAATDQTGRTITMLSAGLVAVAIALTGLTIWYWRFTSPRRRAASEAAEVREFTTEERQPGSAEPAPVDVSQVEAVVEPDSEFDSKPAPSPDDGGSAMGLDSEQWAMLTQAVMDEYLDS